MKNVVRRTFAIHKGGPGEHIIITRLSSFGLDSMGKLGNRIQSAFSAHAVMYDSIKVNTSSGFKST